MAEKSYSLYNDAELLDQRLAVEIGDSYVVLVAGAGNKIAGLEYFTADDNELEQTLEEISQQSSLLSKNYSETRVYYNLAESVMVPVGHFNSSVAAEFVDAAFGNKPARRVNVENVNTLPSMVNVYRSKDRWHDIIARHFRAVTKRHLYSRLVEQVLMNGEQVRLVFYKHSFVMVAAKERQVKIARSFSFSNDEDVLYQLLNACTQVDIDAAETTFNVSGFLDKDSSAFKLLKKYCGTVKLDNASYDVFSKQEQDRYPHHFFTSFISLLS